MSGMRLKIVMDEASVPLDASQEHRYREPFILVPSELTNVGELESHLQNKYDFLAAPNVLYLSVKGAVVDSKQPLAIFRDEDVVKVHIKKEGGPVRPGGQGSRDLSAMAGMRLRILMNEASVPLDATQEYQYRKIFILVPSELTNVGELKSYLQDKYDFLAAPNVLCLSVKGAVVPSEEPLTFIRDETVVR